MSHNRIRVVSEGWRHRLRQLQLLLPVRPRRRGALTTGWAIEHERAKVEVVQRKVDGGVDLTRALPLACGEALEVDDEELGRAADGDALGGLTLGATTRAAPDLVAAQCLRGAVAAQTVADVYRGARRRRSRDLDADAVEGLIGRRRVSACRALQTRDVLPRKEIRQSGVVAV